MIARAPWLLFLEPGMVPDANWIDETRRFIEEAELQGHAANCAAVFRPGVRTHRAPRSSRRWSCCAAALGAGRAASQGLLIAKALYDAAGRPSRGGGEPERDLFRRLGRRHIVLLRSGAIQRADPSRILDLVN